MTEPEFEKMVGEEFPRAVPAKFRDKIKNVGFVVEQEPSRDVRRKHGLRSNETLLGLYHGIPATHRGEGYGVGMVQPDVITLYQLPIEDEARASGRDVRKVIRDTIWHEVGHYFGLDEGAVRGKENKRNKGK